MCERPCLKEMNHSCVLSAALPQEIDMLDIILKARKKEKMDMGKIDRPELSFIRMILCTYGNDTMFIIAPEGFHNTTHSGPIQALFAVN